jgi:hypothetical protein
MHANLFLAVFYGMRSARAVMSRARKDSLVSTSIRSRKHKGLSTFYDLFFSTFSKTREQHHETVGDAHTLDMQLQRFWSTQRLWYHTH